MSEQDPAFASGEKWFLPPEGILDGTDFEIAQRYIDGVRADILFNAEDRTMSPLIKEGHAAVRPELEELLNEQEARLKNGDHDLARLLAHRIEQEVSELNRGERTTVTGQAHLLAERLRKVGHIFNVPRQTNPPSTERLA